MTPSCTDNSYNSVNCSHYKHQIHVIFKIWNNKRNILIYIKLITTYNKYRYEC